MKILFLSPYIPYPLTDGGRVSQFSLIDSLRKEFAITLVLSSYCQADSGFITALKKIWPEVDIREVQLYEAQGPEQVESGQLRRFLRAGKNMASKVKSRLFPNPPQFSASQAESRLETDDPYLITPFHPKPRKYINTIVKLIEESSPDIVQIDLLEYIDLVLIIPAHIKKVFVHHELRFARFDSFFKNSSQPIQPYDEYVRHLVKQQEKHFLNLYDGVFVFSDGDMQKLRGIGVESKIYTSPFAVLENNFQPVADESAAFKKLVFIGGEEHQPNKDAVDWYVNEIAAEINKSSQIALHVVGKWRQETIKQYENNSHVVFAGFVENLIEFCKNSILLVPLRIGSGIRTKILYAMAQGVPVISTSIGCEGIPVSHNESVILANTSHEFATAVNILTTNARHALDMARRAQSIVKDNYGQAIASQKRKSFYHNILDN